MKQESNLDGLIKKIELFIESLQLSNIIGLSKEQSQSIRNLHTSYTTFPLKKWKQQSSENTIILHGENFIQFKNLILELYKVINSKNKNNFSKDYITEIIKNAIAIHIMLHKNETCESPSVKHFLHSKLNEKLTDYLVFIEVDGLELNKRKFKFGDCIFFNMTYKRIKEIKQLKHYLDQFEIKNLINKVYAEVRVKANDKSAALRKAKYELNRNIEIINFIAGLYNNYNLCSGYIRISMYEIKKKDVITFVYSEPDTVSPSFPDNQNHYSLKLENINKNPITKNLFKKITRIINTPVQNDFIRRFLTSIQWAGKAMWEPRIETSFLNYITSLESLLLSNKENELSYRFSLYGAFLFAGKKEYRKLVFKKLKDYYNLRSSIVHSGIYEVEEDDLRDLRIIVINIIINIIQNKKRKFLESKDIDEFDAKLKMLVME